MACGVMMWYFLELYTGRITQNIADILIGGN